MTPPRRAALAASIPHRVDYDGALCTAAAGIRPDGRWGVYWMVDGGRLRDWIAVDLDGAAEAARLARELNARDRLPS